MLITHQTVRGLFVCLAVFVSADSLSADQVNISWIGPTGIPVPESGNWSDAAAWDLGVVPNNGGGKTYAVYISGFENAGLTATVDTSPTIDSLSIFDGARVTVNSGQTMHAGTVSAPGLGADFTLSPGATLDASLVGIEHANSLSLDGTANIGSLGVASDGGFLGVGGLVNAATASSLGVADITGTLNIAHVPLELEGNISVFGTLALDTTNQSMLSSTNTVINGTAVSMQGPGTLFVGASAPPVPAGTTGLSLANGTLDEVIASGTQFGSFLQYNSHIQLGGNLDITLANGYIPQPGQSFAILDTSGLVLIGFDDEGIPIFGPAQVIDTFHNIEGDTFNNGTEKWDVLYKPGEVDLVATAVTTPEPSVFVLTGVGLAGMIWLRNGKRRRARAERPSTTPAVRSRWPSAPRLQGNTREHTLQYAK